MCEFEIPKLAFYSFIIIFVFSLVVAFSIFLNDRKNPVNRNIFIFLIIISLWVGDNILLWYIKNVNANLNLERLTIMLVFIALFFLYFSYYFSGREISLKKKAILVVPFLPFFAFMFSDYNLFLVDASTCDFGEGKLNWYAYLVAIVYVSWSVIILLRKYKEKDANFQVKGQIRILVASIIFLTLWLIFFLIIGNYVDVELRSLHLEKEITSFMMLGVMFFISLIAFAVTRYWLFKMKIISTKVLVTILWMILFIMLFFIERSFIYSVIAFVMYLFLIVVFWIGSISKAKDDFKKLGQKRINLKERISGLRLVAIQAVTVAVWILVGSQFFFVKDQANRVLSGVTLTVTVAFGIMLIGSIRAEMKKKEELEKMNKKLGKANVELKRLDQAKSEFLSISSHQLRTPVTVIKGVASMLKEGDLENAPMEEKMKFYDSILIKSEKLESIIDDILKATYLTTKKYNMMDKDIESMSLEDLIKDILKDFEIEIKKRALRVVLFPVKGALSEVEGQKEYLREVFINLISNAIKYTPSSQKSGDTRDEREERGIIEISLEADPRKKDNILVRISDNGIGISKEEAPKLFKKFSRADNAKNMYTDGTGIGLFMAKEIVEGHGGRVWFESKLGKGSTFFVTLPIHHKQGVDVKRYIFDKQET